MASLMLVLIGIMNANAQEQNAGKLESTQKQLKYAGWKKDYKISQMNKNTPEESVRINCGKSDCSGVMSLTFTAVPATRYEISFTARGNAMLECIIWGTKEAIRILPPKQLNPEVWKPITLSFTVPVETDKAQVVFLAWKQADRWFEISHYQVIRLDRK